MLSQYFSGLGGSGNPLSRTCETAELPVGARDSTGDRWSRASLVSLSELVWLSQSQTLAWLK
jgi:hypothetical protein